MDPDRFLAARGKTRAGAKNGDCHQFVHRHGSRNKVLRLKRIGWLYPIFRDFHFCRWPLALGQLISSSVNATKAKDTRASSSGLNGPLAHLLTCALLLLGCGSVGPPLPPLLNIPERSDDLSARQTPEGVVLEWTWPALTTEGMPLRNLSEFAVHRLEIGGPSQVPSRGHFERNSTLATSLEDAGLEPFGPGEKVRIILPTQSLLGKTFAFGVRGSSRRGRTSDFSELVVIHVVEPPGPPGAPVVAVGQDAIAIEWQAAERASAYRVFRGAESGGPFDEIGRTQKTTLHDPDFQWKKRYYYRVRSFGQSATGEVEGPDSSTGDVFTQDTFPPRPPLDLRTVVTRKSVELSWQPNPEEDLAGYRVWRTGASGEAVALNDELLESPTYSDRAIERGQSYRYALSAADQDGNESERSEPVPVSLR